MTDLPCTEQPHHSGWLNCLTHNREARGVVDAIAEQEIRRLLKSIAMKDAIRTHPSIDETILYAAILHEEQRDKAGVPYIVHPLSVMRRVPEEMWHVAVLHDVKEDCGITDDDLREEGYSEDEITAIDLLTRRHGDHYDVFIARIATSDNLTAITVKLADLDDNLDSSRGWQMPPLQLSRYLDARTRLQMVKEGR